MSQEERLRVRARKMFEALRRERAFRELFRLKPVAAAVRRALAEMGRQS